jgi:hypothetical protein
MRQRGPASVFDCTLHGAQCAIVSAGACGDGQVLDDREAIWDLWIWDEFPRCGLRWHILALGRQHPRWAFAS